MGSQEHFSWNQANFHSLADIYWWVIFTLPKNDQPSSTTVLNERAQWSGVDPHRECWAWIFHIQGKTVCPLIQPAFWTAGVFYLGIIHFYPKVFSFPLHHCSNQESLFRIINLKGFSNEYLVRRTIHPGLHCIKYTQLLPCQVNLDKCMCWWPFENPVASRRWWFDKVSMTKLQIMSLFNWEFNNFLPVKCKSHKQYIQ